LCWFNNFWGYLDVAVSMQRWLKNRNALRATTPCAGKVAAEAARFGARSPP
jgi:hypothetical protein